MRAVRRSSCRCRSSPSSASECTMPKPCARSAVIGSAVKNMALTTCSGSERAKISTPAGKYGTPSLAGVMAKLADRTATIRSHATTRLQAAPHTVPSTAATTGAGSSGIPAITASTGLSHSAGSACTGTSSRSWPAEKTLTPGSARSTTTRLRAAPSASAWPSWAIIAVLSELRRSVRRSTTVATPPASSSVTRSMARTLDAAPSSGGGVL